MIVTARVGMNLWQWLALLLRMETLYLAVAKIYPKGGIYGSIYSLVPLGEYITVIPHLL